MLQRAQAGTSLADMILLVPLVCWRRYGNLSTCSVTIPHHKRPKRGIAMLSVDEFPYPRKQTRCNEFIPCSNNVCEILKCFHSFKISDTSFIWPKSSCKHSVARSHRSSKESGPRLWSPSSMTFLSHYISRWWHQTCDTYIYFTVDSQSEARVSTEHGIMSYTTCMTLQDLSLSVPSIWFTIYALLFYASIYDKHWFYLCTYY